VDSIADSAVSAKAAGESFDGLPPWFNAALDSGVVFYDPEGKEVVVPSDKVGAFKAALETVNEFEPEPCKGSLPSVAPAADAAAAPAKASDSEACGGRQAAAEASGAAAASNEDAESRRLDLKVNLQKRYFALLRSGLEPNDAAARAILEAGGHAVEEQQPGAGYCAGVAAPAAAEQRRGGDEVIPQRALVA